MLAPGRLPLTAKLRLAVEVTTTYAVARRAMKRHDLPTSIERLRALPCRRPHVASYHEGLRLGRAVASTLRVLPADSRCLMQSLVLTGLLARRGIDSTLVIGVRPGETFGAHAWVELQGYPLLPPMEQQFTRLVDL